VARMDEERNLYKFLVREPEGKKPLGRPRRRWRMGSELILGRLAGRIRSASVGSGYGPVVGCCECGDEHSLLSPQS
jgi:hypothetical protein